VKKLFRWLILVTACVLFFGKNFAIGSNSNVKMSDGGNKVVSDAMELGDEDGGDDCRKRRRSRNGYSLDKRQRHGNLNNSNEKVINDFFTAICEDDIEGVVNFLRFALQFDCLKEVLTTCNEDGILPVLMAAHRATEKGCLIIQIFSVV